jgi:glycosyltransferase involved in cell wall biosynthesis
LGIAEAEGGIMQISLIITTYNWKEALRLSLQSAISQSLLPLEIVVADDGSGPETAELVQTMRDNAPIPIIHSWQEDKGFRSAKSRNKAIARAKGEYILLLDGDILLNPHFVADHCAFAQPGFFVQGTRVLLGSELSSEILEHGRWRSPFFAKGVGNKKNCLRSLMLARLFSLKSRRLIGAKTCNFAFWKKDGVAVNGFNEDFIGWGREDSEFVARLLNNGIGRKDLKFHALGYHLHHRDNARARLAVNDALLKKTIDEKSRWCERGINQYL